MTTNFSANLMNPPKLVPLKTEEEKGIILDKLITPTLLKNFELYVVLKPKTDTMSQIKNNDNDPGTIDDTPLICLSDDECTNSSSSKTNSTSQHSTTQINRSTSSKDACDLIDLYENILVTASDVQDHSRAVYASFFDKYEDYDKVNTVSNDKRYAANTQTTEFSKNNTNIPYKTQNTLIDYCNRPIVEENVPRARMVDQIFDDLFEKQKTLIPKLDMDRFDDIDEELIDNVLYEKCDESLRIKQLKDNAEKLRETVKGIAKDTNTVVRTSPASIKISLNSYNMSTLYSSLVDTKLKSKIDIQNPLRYYEPAKFCYPIQGAGLDIFEFRTLAIKKNSKQYAKKNIRVSDEDKRNFTKGPSLDEKTTVLPQIMKRLIAKKDEMNKENNWHKRLILDDGTCRKKPVMRLAHNKNEVMLNPEILTEDCNRDRLRALQTRRMFESFVHTGNIIP